MMVNGRERSVLAVFFVAASLVLSSGSFCHAQEILDVPEWIQTPEHVAEWFSSDFRYQFKLPDRRQSLDETLSSRAGDCDDFAFLASAILKGKGIDNKVVIIKFKGLNVMHAICVYKNETGEYSFISNESLRHTNETNLVRALKWVYHDLERIIIARN